MQIAQYELGKDNTLAAIKALEKSIEIDSLFPDPYVNLAVLESKLGENQKALHVLNEMIKRFSENDYAFYLRSILKAEIGDIKGAIDDMTRALEINQDPDYYYNLILMHNQIGNTQKARNLLLQAQSQFPENERLKQLRI